jgi:hypothetical protein
MARARYLVDAVVVGGQSPNRLARSGFEGSYCVKLGAPISWASQWSWTPYGVGTMSNCRIRQQS